MNSKHEIEEQEDSFEEIGATQAPTVDDFIKELEAKEKDLHITSDLTIELAESDFDPDNLPGFVQADLAAASSGLASSRPFTVGMKTRVFELQNEVEALNGKLADLRTQRNELVEKSDRRLKDFENYKYRMDRERRGAFINQIGNLASQMLPVLDNLERALDAAMELPEEKRAEVSQFFEGIVLVNQQLNEVLAGMGVQPIATVGEPFDPNFHEAVSADERSDLPNNTISMEMLRGYRIGNMVIRHSMVRVTTTPQISKAERQEAKRKSDETPANPIPEPTEVLAETGRGPEADASFLEAE